MQLANASNNADDIYMEADEINITSNVDEENKENENDEVDMEQALPIRTPEQVRTYRAMLSSDLSALKDCRRIPKTATNMQIIKLLGLKMKSKMSNDVFIQTIKIFLPQQAEFHSMKLIRSWLKSYIPMTVKTFEATNFRFSIAEFLIIMLKDPQKKALNYG